MATAGSAALCTLDFNVTVNVRDEQCFLQWRDEVTAGAPGMSILHTMLFRRGTGAFRTNRWNAFLYDRTDTVVGGGARPAGTIQVPLTAGLPTVQAPSPDIAAVSHRPNLTTAEQTAFASGTRIFRGGAAVADSGPLDTYWAASFSWTVPTTEASESEDLRIHETVTFKGRVEMVQ